MIFILNLVKKNKQKDQDLDLLIELLTELKRTPLPLKRLKTIIDKHSASTKYEEGAVVSL